MNLLYLILSSVSVSLDGLSAGAVIGASRARERGKCVILIGAIVSLMCLAACAFGEELNASYRNFSDCFGGIILVAIGFKGLFKKEKHIDFVRNKGFSLNTGEIVSLGVGVGADGACASLSLSSSGYGFYPAVTVGAFHLMFVYLGTFFGEKLGKNKLAGKMPSVAIIFLGATKFI